MKTMEKKLQQNKRLFDKIAAKYDNNIIKWWTHRYHTPVLREIVANKNTKILDIGCGTGELLLQLQGKARLSGIDISEKMLTIARKKLPHAVLKKAEVHHLPFNDNFFDCVVSTETFHHFPNQIAALMEMRRVAKKGSRVIVADINFYLRALHSLFQKIEPGNVKVNCAKEMMLLFQHAGFAAIQQKRFIFGILTSGKK